MIEKKAESGQDAEYTIRILVVPSHVNSDAFQAQPLADRQRTKVGNRPRKPKKTKKYAQEGQKH